MLKLNLTRLITAVKQTTPAVFPELDKGTDYLYKNVFCPAANGNQVFLSDLDFEAFSSDDVTALYELYGNVFEKRSSQADEIAGVLRKTAPICKAAAFI